MVGLLGIVISAVLLWPDQSRTATSCNTPFKVNSTAYFDSGDTIIGSASMPCQPLTHRVCLQRWTATGWSGGFDCANDKRNPGGSIYFTAMTHHEVCGSPYRTVSKYGNEPAQVSNYKVPCREGPTFNEP